ncbi:hypothetical protein KP509_17G060900 [Ceratopteris richardii]|uniref:Uncharacterized protein n=1 Tax=Ceratopteris richardii TaxID=49495 RepID=A0A8T2SW74_CERRI|nr:hypothetical protein KP509_17G060900 [Ceratopteris richardii]
MGHNRPLFELIVEETRRRAWNEGYGEQEGVVNLGHSPIKGRKKGRVGRWLRSKNFSAREATLGQEVAAPPPATASPTATAASISTAVTTTTTVSATTSSKCSTEFESALDSLCASWPSPLHHDILNMGAHELDRPALPCLEGDGHRYLEVAAALDMMELYITQARSERDMALSQALDLRFAMDAMRNKLQQVEQYCLHLNTQLFMQTRSIS